MVGVASELLTLDKRLRSEFEQILSRLDHVVDDDRPDPARDNRVAGLLQAGYQRLVSARAAIVLADEIRAGTIAAIPPGLLVEHHLRMSVFGHCKAALDLAASAICRYRGAGLAIDEGADCVSAERHKRLLTEDERMWLASCNRGDGLRLAQFRNVSTHSIVRLNAQAGAQNRQTICLLAVEDPFSTDGDRDDEPSRRDVLHEVWEVSDLIERLLGFAEGRWVEAVRLVATGPRPAV